MISSESVRAVLLAMDLVDAARAADHVNAVALLAEVDPSIVARVAITLAAAVAGLDYDGMALAGLADELTRE